MPPHSNANGYKNEGHSEIQKFYKGQSIFITGGTGFIGKILLETLLRSCELDSVYLMIRSKKGKDVQTRHREFMHEQIFKLLDDEQKSLVHVVEGELGLPNMGLSDEDRTLLKNKINIVVHCGANVRFDSNLKHAININVRGTLDVLNLCREMPHLLAVVYVSTAFSNCNRTSIDECFYKPGLNPELALNLAKAKGGDDALKIVEPLILDGWPNAYAFTKAIAESLIRLKGKDLPITIFRPSIVLGTSYQSPMAGYVDNFLGPTGLFIGVGVGVIRTLEINRTTPAPLVPADLCANGIIVSAWHIANHSYDEPIIFNFVNSKYNNWTWYKICTECLEYIMDESLEATIWHPGMVTTTNPYVAMFLRFWLHLVPATLADSLLHAVGKQPQALRVLRKFATQSAHLTRFWNTHWQFSQKNMLDLVSSLSHADTKLFNIDMDNFDWSRNKPTMIKGLKVYLLKEPAETTPECRKRFFRYTVAHKTLKGIFFVILFFILFKICKIIFPCVINLL